MKKWMLILTLAASVLVLAACGTEADSSDVQNAQEVFEKSVNAMESVNSYSMSMDMEQEIPFGDEVLNTSTSMTGDLVLVPLSMHQVMNMSVPGEGTMEMEMYLTEEGVYMSDSESGMWMNMPEELFGDLMDLESMQTNPQEELERLAEFVDDFSYAEEGDFYVLTLSASGDKFKALIMDTLEEVTGGDELLAEALEDIEIHQIDYEIKIDKETYYQTELVMDMDFTITADGETVRIKQKVDATFSNFNGVDEIVVPQEVIDSAVDLGGF
ncbi:DUF6612 family protein [Bacillus horti]|uniref:Outer membrane lipoprotein-sorting protein n=1 Tax=Caldalkalibacillus horti TaxID=77523 RepID=A0ABT9VTZ0_9BACI|nr:DUF6612 family protein [Bacillus horti]MDQ0164453.1 outer membrane lipoprotein-sorting protein [Bacillus horti]